MKAFAQLIKTLDEASQTNAKLAALSEYFKSAAPEDRVWCIAIFSGRRPARSVTTAVVFNLYPFGAHCAAVVVLNNRELVGGTN